MSTATFLKFSLTAMKTAGADVKFDNDLLLVMPTTGRPTAAP
jgi:hypothetical protein